MNTQRIVIIWLSKLLILIDTKSNIFNFLFKFQFIREKSKILVWNLTLKTFTSKKVSVGCYPSGGIWAVFNDGLTSNMTSKIHGCVNPPKLLVNGYQMFKLTNGMTIESCSSICLENSFLFSAIGG